jgi:NADPH:quinone reductase
MKAVWNELENFIEDGSLKGTVYDKKYQGLKDVSKAMEDVAARKVWGKAIIDLESTKSNI